jgi:WD40 repeat protein
VAFSPDGQTVLTSSHDATARFWDAATGKPVSPPLPHDRVVNTAVFSPDGRQALTGSNDKTARLWEAPIPLKEDVERIVLWTQVLTGMELDREEVVRVLDAEAWHQRRQYLQELGGPPIP